MRDAADIQTALETILAHSAAMLAAASDERWDVVIATEAARRPLMHETFSTLSNASAPRGTEVAIREVQRLDQRVAELVRAAHAANGQALGQVRRGKAAARIYTGVSGR
jgi:hypothetical protein